MSDVTKTARCRQVLDIFRPWHPVCSGHGVPMMLKAHDNKWRCLVKARAQNRERSRRFYLANVEDVRRRTSERKRAVYWKRKERGVCVRCGGPLLSESRCWDCLNRMEEQRALSL